MDKMTCCKVVYDVGNVSNYGFQAVFYEAKERLEKLLGKNLHNSDIDINYVGYSLIFKASRPSTDEEAYIMAKENDANEPNRENKEPEG